MAGIPNQGVEFHSAVVNTVDGSSGTLAPVANSALLFRGDYARVGNDLVISHNEHGTLRITEYFSHETLSPLYSEDGALLDGATISRLAGPLAPGQYAQAGAGAAGVPIGSVQTITGGATAQRTDGTTVDLNAGDPVFQGDVVQTQGGSSLVIVFVDDTLFSLSADARMILDELVYSPGGSGNSMVMNLVQGSFVFVTGQVAPTGDMRVETPTATMGIRGTTPIVNINALDGSSRFSLTQDPDGTLGSYQLFDRATGQLIGTVNTESEVIELSSIGATPLISTKTQADIDAEQGEIQRAFDAYRSANLGQTNNNNNNGNAPNDGGNNQPPNAEPNDTQSGTPSEFSDPGTGAFQPLDGAGSDEDAGGASEGDGGTNAPPDDGGQPPQQQQESTVRETQPPQQTVENEEPVEEPADDLGLIVPSVTIETLEDEEIIITDLAIQVPDDGIASVTLVAQSTITLAQTDGLTFTLGDGVDDEEMSFIGSEADINAALNGLTYTPSPNSVIGNVNFTLFDGTNFNVTDVPIEIQPVADAPTVFDISVQLDESGSVTAPLLGFDPDAGDTLSLFALTEPDAGSFEVFGDGTFTFDTNGEFETLSVGETQTVTFQYSAIDSTGLVSENPATVSIAIKGVDDPAVVTGDTSGSVTEGDLGDLETTSGSIGVTDIDANDNPTFANATATGAFGSIAVNAVGDTWTYTLDQSKVQGLNAGDTVTDTLTLTDSEGNTQTISIDIAGTDDLSTLLEDFEDGLEEWTVLADTDADVAGSALLLASDNFAPEDIFEILGTVEQGIEALDNGEVTGGSAIARSFELTSAGTITFDFLFSTDDYLPFNDFAVVTLGETVFELGDVAGTDLDGITTTDSLLWQSFAVPVDTAGTVDLGFGVFNVRDMSVPTSIEIDTIEFRPGTPLSGGALITPTTLTTTEDGPTVSLDLSTVFNGTIASVSAGLPAGGTLNGTTLSIDPSVAFQALSAGEQSNTLLPIEITDDLNSVFFGFTRLIVTGVDDAAVVSGTTTGSVTEGDLGDVSTTSGSIGVTDADSADNPTFANVTAFGAFGSLVVNGAGDTWTYTLDQTSVQNLDAGDQVSDVLVLADSDGNLQTITVNILGTDDEAVVTGSTTGTVQEGNLGDVVTVSGSIGVSDVDGDANPTFANATNTGTFGSIAVNGTGDTWTYTLDQALVQDLNDGETVTDSLTLTDSEGNTQTISIEIIGTDDQPVAVADTLGGIDVLIATPYVSEAQNAQSVLQETERFDSVDYLTQTSGLSVEDYLEYEAILTWTNASYPNPVEAGNLLSEYVESGGGVVMATYAFSNPWWLQGAIAGEAPLLPTTVRTTITGNVDPTLPDDKIFDNVDIEALSGSFFHNLNYADPALNPGATLLATDGNGVNMIARNADGSIIAANMFPGFETASNVDFWTLFANMIEDVSASTGSGTNEDTAVAIQFDDLLRNDTEPNGGLLDITAISSGTSTLGAALELDPDNGTILYDPTTSTQLNALDEGDIAEDSFTYTIKNLNGKTDTATVTVRVEGVDDAAIVTGDTSGTVTEGDIGDTKSTTGNIGVSDVDANDDPSFANAFAQGLYGTITVNAAGNTWTYTLDQSLVQELDAGDQVIDTVTLTDSEGNTQTIEITVEGKDDAAIVTGDTTGTIFYGYYEGEETVSGSIGVSDIDADDNPTFANATDVGDYGSIEVNAAGDTWTYTLDLYESEEFYYEETIVDTVTLTDNEGNTRDIEITIDTGYDEEISFSDVPEFNFDIQFTSLELDNSLRSGDTTYGFNSTETGTEFDFDSNPVPSGLIIFDAGGVDTLDMSGFATPSVIDLTPGALSSVNGEIGNIEIDADTTIENAIGGTANDTLFGSDVDNTLEGGAGLDSLTGGGGSDTFVLSSDDAADIIADFELGADRLDLQSLLDANFAPEDQGDYVATRQTEDGTVLSVDRDGTGEDHGFKDVAVLEGVDAGGIIDFVFADNGTQVQDTITA